MVKNLNYDGASTSYPKGVSIDNANGRVYFANTRLNPAVNGVNGDRELFSVYFSPLGIWGKTYMNLSGLKLSDPDGLDNDCDGLIDEDISCGSG